MAANEALVRLALAVFVGALVGVERQWHHKTAGIKTHALVTAGAAAFALISELGLGSGSNPVQIAAGVVTGIGFIGGGVIMRRGASVQGINTAATLWAAGGLGLAVGGGHYAVASAVLLAVLVAQIPLRWVAFFIDRHSGPSRSVTAYRVVVACGPEATANVRSELEAFAKAARCELVEHGEARSGREAVIEARLSLGSGSVPALRELGARLVTLPGVARAEWSRVVEEERD